MGGEVGIPHLVGIMTHPRHEIPVLEVAVEAGDVLPPLPDHGAIDRGVGIDHLGRDEDHQFALVVLDAQKLGGQSIRRKLQTLLRHYVGGTTRSTSFCRSVTLATGRGSGFLVGMLPIYRAPVL